MAEWNNQIELKYLKINATTNIGMFVERYNISAGTYGDPAVAFLAGVNEWYIMAETAIDATTSLFKAQAPKGQFRIQSKASTGVYTTLAAYDEFHHSTLDYDLHILNSAGHSDLRHDTEAINVPAADQGRLGLTLDAALDSITGATWDKDTDISLKGHVDDTVAAHQATAIACTVGATTTVEAALDNHETRIAALETGSAAAITGLSDTGNQLGVGLYWDAQSVTGIEYWVRYLWKHSYETAPAAYTDLTHEARQQSPETEIGYWTRKIDLHINQDDDLVLYYAIGAKGRADASPVWSAVQHCGVIIPEYRSEQILHIADLSWAQVSPATGIDYVSIDTDEAFPTCSHETGGVPDDNWLEAEYPFDDSVLKGISVRSGTTMSGTATVQYLTTAGASGSFTVSSATKKGATGVLNLPMGAGDIVKIWSLDPKGMGHLNIRVKLQTT